MSTRTKEEELALDEKIARIQRKNEEILRRQKEIEEDKRMAEQQNAIVKLRPSTTNVSRERTPALKPSNRELRHDTSEDFPLQEPPLVQRNTRGSFRGRGGERSRGQGDWKTSGGPPPDPRSFLYDDERDGPVNETREVKREPDRVQREERDNRDNFRGGGREFQRGRRRGGMEYRGERGRRGGGGGRGGRRNEEEEWRAERMKIDEARIQRQRAADGKWRREWDNDKTLQEPLEDKHEVRKLNSPSKEKWSPPSQYRGQFHTSPDRHARLPGRGGAIASRGGRGRGRLDPAELEMPLDKFQVEVLQSQTSPRQKASAAFSAADNFSRHPAGGEVASPPSPHPHPPQDEFMLDPTRSVACVGNTVKISIPNTGAAQTTPKPQRQHHETRGRFKSQTSYSSQSDDDAPRDRSHRSGRRQRSQKPVKGQEKNMQESKNSANDQSLTKASLDSTLPVQNKPPLPPFRAEQKPSAELKNPTDPKDGDESWEDVTTSGTESMGEDFSSVHSSPLRRTIVNTMIISGKQTETLATDSIPSLEFSQNQPFDEGEKISYEEYLKELETNEMEKNLEAMSFSEHEQQEQIYSEVSSNNISLDVSGNILLYESASEELVDRETSLSATTLLDEMKCLDSENKSELVQDQEEEIIAKGVGMLKLVEQDELMPAEVCLELESSSSLNSKEEDQGKDNIVKGEFECKSDQTIADFKTQEDPITVGEEKQVLSDNKDLLVNANNSNSTEAIINDGK